MNLGKFPVFGDYACLKSPFATGRMQDPTRVCY